MHVTAAYINSHRFDYENTCICAGMKFHGIDAYHRANILGFYLSLFQQMKEKKRFRYLPVEKWLRFKFLKK